ncbi:MAG: hypothetical protein KAS32_27765 [Candidatus Peribacteraceae bacterium]|nr:hypothetical protein [Candidatus Peribacteraceae bacterium]
MTSSINDISTIDWGRLIMEWDMTDMVPRNESHGSDRGIYIEYLREILNDQPIDDLLPDFDDQSKKEPKLDDDDKYLERMGCIVNT